MNVIVMEIITIIKIITHYKMKEIRTRNIKTITWPWSAPNAFLTQELTEDYLNFHPIMDQIKTILPRFGDSIKSPIDSRKVATHSMDNLIDSFANTIMIGDVSIL